MKTPTPLDPLRLASAREAVVAGLTVREAAQRFGLNYEAVKRRASREKWPTTARIREAANQSRRGITEAATQAVVASMNARGQRYLGKLANASERFAALAEDMSAEDLLSRARSIETLDKVARRTFGMNDESTQQTTILGFGPMGDCPIFAHEYEQNFGPPIASLPFP